GVIAGEFTVFSKAFASYSNLMLPGPVNASNDKITVIAHIERLRLLDVLEVEQSIKFFVDVRLSWTDPAIRWDPETDKQKTSSIKVPEDTVWSPDITIFSAVSKTFPIPSSRRVLRVNYDGAIVKSTAQIILNPCSLNVNKFPFDSQHCQFRIGPWAYDNSEVLLRPYTSTTLNISDQEKFRGNSEWTLSSIEVQAYADDSYGKGQVYDEVHYTIRLKRAWPHYFWVLILPTFICATLCIFGLFMPSESSGYRFEKVSLGVMTLISMTMVLETFSSAMPKTANLPLLGIYVLAEELVCACATLVTVSLSLAHERATTRRWTVPKCFAKGLLWHSYDDRIRMRTASIQPNHWSSFLTPHLARISTHLAEMQSDESISAQWMRVFDRLDLAAMAIFQILNVIINLAILIGGS
ncbi:hypothetical protein PFISCL1PPCAC_519, partial [Pristionchus fissidentatus]